MGDLIIIAICVILMFISAIPLIPPLKNFVERRLIRFASDETLRKYSLWDASGGEPMNIYAEEMMRRDGNWEG